MTREVRYDSEGHYRAPRYIDHGHLARKAVYWAVCVLVLPLAAVDVVAGMLDARMSRLADLMSGLRAWAHPCLYAKLPRE